MTKKAKPAPDGASPGGAGRDGGTGIARVRGGAAGEAAVEAYIGGFAPAIGDRLRDIRALVRRAAPGAEEGLAYGMPSYRLGGNLLHFAAFAGHIGLYGLSGHLEAVPEAAGYLRAKGTLAFPHDRPLPLALIGKLVAARCAEAAGKPAAARKRGA